MGFEKHYSLASLIEEGRKRAAGLDVVTFDLFDTLVIRRIHDPDLVKLPVARYISARAERAGIKISWQQVQKRRDDIEAEERAVTGRSYDDHEACYPSYMGALLREIFSRDDIDHILEDVSDYELFMENQMLVPRYELVDWLKELSEQGKRIFVVSDIYLPAEHLKVLVKHAGFLQFVEEVISSADTFLAKASGKGFELLEEKFSLNKEGWLHVGDNPISDGLRPDEFGIDALVLHDHAEKRRKFIIKCLANYSKGRPFWRGRALQQLMQPHEGENVERPLLYREGYTFLGPLMGGFIQYLADKCLEKHITKIFFLSREGYTFKKYWDACMPALKQGRELPETEYLYVSRMALAGASCAHQGLIEANADIAFLPPGNRDFRDVCRIFQFDSDRFVQHLERYDLAIDTCLSPNHDGFDEENRKAFNRMLEDDEFQMEVRQQSAASNQALLRYLDDVGLFNHRDVAIVDIGWLGTIQRFLYEAVAHREDCPRFHGLLFGATRGIPYPESSENKLEGVIFDRHRFKMAPSTILYARDLFEEACRAPHPTLNGYRLTDDGYELEFRETSDKIGQAELEQDKHFEELQRGLLDSAPRFGAASALLGYSLIDYRPWFNYLMLSKLAFATTKEIKEIRHKHHLDDFHGQQKVAKEVAGRMGRGLWDSSLTRIRFSPFLRSRLFIRHLIDRIKE